MTSAAVVIIGDEILTGKFRDENGPYFIKRLRTLGVSLKRLLVLPDEPEVIGEEVRRCAEAVDHVFTTGGVGPTHDDKTFEALAAGFGVGLEVRPELSRLLDRFGLPVNEATLRMATVPVGSELIERPGMAYPVVRFRNIWILPGVPRLAQQKFETIAPELAGDAVHVARVHARDRETLVAQALGELDARHPEVNIGSYPRFGEGECRLIVTLESLNAEALSVAQAEVRDLLDVVDIDDAEPG